MSGRIDVFAVLEGSDEALAAVERLIEAARKFRDQYEREADAREDYFLTDPGCVICTSGATPHNFDTGICGYHATCSALAKVTP